MCEREDRRREETKRPRERSRKRAERGGENKIIRDKKDKEGKSEK